MSDDLVDLSLFSYSPTSDHYLSLRAATHSVHNPPNINAIGDDTYHPRDRETNAARPFHGPPNRPAARKPLPRPPPRVICGPFAIPRECDIGAGCLLNRVKRKRKDVSPGPSNTRLPQRRNIVAPPQLLLSASPQHSHDQSSELVWMPEEQMWLVVGEGNRERNVAPSNLRRPHQQPSFIVPRARSEPIEAERHQETLTPPPSSSRARRQRPIEERDEERLSPLFHEAMNSVPMEDTFEAPPPPSYEGLMRARSSPNLPLSAPPPRVYSPQSPFEVSPLSAQLQGPSTFHRTLSAGNSPTISTDSRLGEITPTSTNRQRSRTDSHLTLAMNNPTIWTAPDAWNNTRNTTRQPQPRNNLPSNPPHITNRARTSGLWSGWARKLANSKPST